MTISHRLQSLLETCKQMRANGHSIEVILLFLRQEGCSKMESIRAVMELQDMSLRDAKSTVHFSEAWKDTRQRDDRLHESLDSMTEKSEQEI